MSIFEVEIMRPGRFGANTSATLKMPATWAELQDAKHNNIVETSYGLLSRKDGGPVLSQSDTPDMDMGGMSQ
jgi:hypothetical protein